MAFEGLSEKLNATFKHLRGKGRLSEEDIKLAMREVRLALLEADVSYKVVKDFVKTVSERAVGAEVLDSLTPAQQVIKIVSEELTALMGGANAKLTFASKPPTVVMMVGLQGAGKRERRQARGLLPQAGPPSAAHRVRRVPSRGHHAVTGRRQAIEYSRFRNGSDRPRSDRAGGRQVRR